MSETFIQKLKKLSLPLKLVGIGALVAFVSVFLPWYSDIDKFKTGDTFLGVTGPLYLIGFLFFGLSAFSLILVSYNTFGKKIPKMPVSEENGYIFSGSASLFLLLIACSIYFHSKFGVNITLKQAGFGMIMAFLGASFVIIGGYLKKKTTKVSFDSEGRLDQLIDLPRPQQSIRESGEISSEDISQEIKVNIESKI